MAAEISVARESGANPINALDRRAKSVANIYDQVERIIGIRHGQRAINIGRAYMRNIEEFNARQHGVSTMSTPSLRKAKYPSSVYRGLNQEMRSANGSGT